LPTQGDKVRAEKQKGHRSANTPTHEMTTTHTLTHLHSKQKGKSAKGMGNGNGEQEAEAEPGHLNAAQNWIWGSLEKFQKPPCPPPLHQPNADKHFYS